MLSQLLAACGGKSSTAPDENQGGGHAGQSTAGSSHGGSANGGSANGGGGSGGGGGATNECTRYDDESPIGVNVTLINKTTQTLYVGPSMQTCGTVPLFSVADEAGKELPALGDCRTSCSGARGGIGGCPAVCLYPRTVKLEPGELHSTVWDALYRVQGSLPESCLTYEGAQGDQQCDQAKRIGAGTYTFRAVAATEVDCTMTTGSPMCEACMPDPNGACTISGGIVGGEKVLTEATATLDARYGFSEPTAKPNPGAGDAAPGSLPTAEIELIFGP